MLFTAINTRLASALTGVALAAAVGAPAALARPIDPPGASDATHRYDRQLGMTPHVYLSPDARDRNLHYNPQLPVAPPTAELPAPAPSGFDWVSAAIGAAAGAGLLIMVLASARSVAAASRRIRVAR